MQYIKSLDSLRTIAVFMVLVSHWLPHSFLNKFQAGSAGVTIFFVLSGFLITMILFDGRNDIEGGRSNHRTVLKSFIIRRALRIFPIYYLVILSAFLYSIFWGLETEKFYYFLTYTANFYYFKLQEFPDYFSHTWSLAVEEQFYLLWPWLMLFIGRRYLLHCIILFIVVGLSSQILLKDVPMRGVLTFTCFDSLGLGALLAWFVTYKRAYLRYFCIISGAIATFAAASIVNTSVFMNSGFLPFRFEVSLVAVFIISYIAAGFYNGFLLPLPVRLVLDNPVMVFLGKISYGMYLYHTFILYFTDMSYETYASLPQFIKDHFTFYIFSFRLILLLGVCLLSWYLIEKPFLSLKKHFTYQSEKKVVVLPGSLIDRLSIRPEGNKPLN
jgi:peptidoglycan/LPS O-acetylase OafA/YrhL